jgi:hypothetical protein
MEHGKRQGQGKYTWGAQGAAYEGEYAGNRRQGVGMMTFPDKSKYEGMLPYGPLFKCAVASPTTCLSALAASLQPASSTCWAETGMACLRHEHGPRVGRKLCGTCMCGAVYRCHNCLSHAP